MEKRLSKTTCLLMAFVLLFGIMGFCMTSTVHAGAPGPIKITKAEYSKSKSKLTVKYTITKKNTKPVKIELTNPATVDVYTLKGGYWTSKGTHTFTKKVKMSKPPKANYSMILYKVGNNSSLSKIVKWKK